MTDVVIVKKSGNTEDDTLQSRTYPPCATGCDILFTWTQVYIFKDNDTLTISNFQSLDFELCTPASDFPIPELRDTCNILVKAEGNRLTIPLSWTVKDEACSIVCTTPVQTIKTVQEQICFFINTFQPNSIEDSYTISVDGITRWGTFRKITFSKSESTPVTYTGRMEFIAGDVVAGEA